MPELRIVNWLRDSASFSRLPHFVLNIPTLTGNVFKSVNVNLKCISKNHDINYLSRKLKYKQTFAIVCSFTVSVNKLQATDSIILLDWFPWWTKWTVFYILHFVLRWFRHTLMDHFHRFQTTFDRIKTELSLVTGTMNQHVQLQSKHGNCLVLATIVINSKT